MIEKVDRRISYLICPQSYETNLWLGEGGREDEGDQLVDLASIGWKSPLDRLLRTRMATRPIQFTGMEERNTPKSELLPKDRRPILISQCECRI